MVDSIHLRFQPQRYFNSKNRKLIYYFIRNKSLPFRFRWYDERILFALIRRFNRNIEWNVISRGLQFSTQFHGKLFLNRPIQVALVNGPRMNGGPREPDLCTHAHTLPLPSSLFLSRSIHPASRYRETKRRPRWHQSDRWRKIDEVVAFGISYWLTSSARPAWCSQLMNALKYRAMRVHNFAPGHYSARVSNGQEKNIVPIKHVDASFLR